MILKTYDGKTVIAIVQKHLAKHPNLMWAILKDLADAPTDPDVIPVMWIQEKSRGMLSMGNPMATMVAAALDATIDKWKEELQEGNQ